MTTAPIATPISMGTLFGQLFNILLTTGRNFPSVPLGTKIHGSRIFSPFTQGHRRRSRTGDYEETDSSCFVKRGNTTV